MAIMQGVDIVAMTGIFLSEAVDIMNAVVHGNSYNFA